MQNKDQSNLAKTESQWQVDITPLWQHRTDGLAAICNSPGGQGPPHLTQCVIGPNKCTSQMASKSVERFKQGAHNHKCDRDTQTDRPRYGEMCRNRRNRLCCNSDSASSSDTILMHDS